MPLYEYHCQECGEDFEKMVRFSEAAHSPQCAVCGSADTHKQISTFASKLTGASSLSSASSASSCSSGAGRFS